MESNYAKYFSESYKGSLIHSGSDQTFDTEIKIERLNNILVKISFESDLGKLVFRAVVSEQKEGVLLFIQNRVTKDFILSGKSGFLYKKPNVHGGIIHKLDAFYFHLRLDNFNAPSKEIYFFGKKKSNLNNHFVSSLDFHSEISA